MTELRSLSNDLKFGLTKEVDILPILVKTWNDETIRNTKDIYNDEYCSFDFENKSKSTWEVKSRRITKNEYTTTILPFHKPRKVDSDQYFVFNFTDICSYIKYDKELFKTFSKRNVTVKRQGARAEPVLHYEIPVKLLTDIK
jgi:hypothetical protein